MKRVFAFVALLTVLMPVAAQQASQQQQPKTEPQHKLLQFQMALLKRGPKEFPANYETSSVHKGHLAHIQALLASDRAMIAGRIMEDPDLKGVVILRTKSADEARSWIMADPAITAGHFEVEMHPWWSEDVMKKSTTPEKMMIAYLAFLVRGEKWTPEKTPHTEAIQKAHMDNINRLAEMKKLVVAGPFGDNGTLRGIFVFKVDSLEEARVLALTDPAVVAGRLALKVHMWEVPAGILP